MRSLLPQNSLLQNCGCNYLLKVNEEKLGKIFQPQLSFTEFFLNLDPLETLHKTIDRKKMKSTCLR